MNELYTPGEGRLSPGFLLDTENVWREKLYPRFKGQAYPLWRTENTITPAASLWAGAREWVRVFRGSKLGAGDRLILHVPPSSAFLQVLIAALWERLTLVLLPLSEPLEPALEALDASAAVSFELSAFSWLPGENGIPESIVKKKRRAQSPPTPEARFLLRSSGTGGAAKWVALSDENVLSVIESHSPLLNLERAVLLSSLPWSHAFGLVIELMTGLLAGAEILRDPFGGKEPELTASLLVEEPVTHWCCVPLSIRRLMQLPQGASLLETLSGGVVGGAPISADLVPVLENTRLRVGYGQTEASPGIALGAPGEWSEHFLGSPVGCETRIGEDARLWFKGKNACLGFWENGRLNILEAGRWVDTGDRAQATENGLRFLGRAEDDFKLANGLWVRAGVLEAQLRKAFPSVKEAMLGSEDGERLTLYWSGEEDALTLETARFALGSLGSKLWEARSVPVGAWKRTAKGAIDRGAMLNSDVIYFKGEGWDELVGDERGGSSKPGKRRLLKL